MVNYISVVTTKPPVEINHLPEDIINYRRQEPCDSNSQLLLLYNRLSSKYKKDEIIKLLQIIAGNSPGARVIGRIQMLSLLHKCDLDISANQLRTLLKELEIADLIHVGKTKQGTTLSRNGKTFRDWLEKGISKIWLCPSRDQSLSKPGSCDINPPYHQTFRTHPKNSVSPNRNESFSKTWIPVPFVGGHILSNRRWHSHERCNGRNREQGNGPSKEQLNGRNHE